VCRQFILPVVLLDHYARGEAFVPGNMRPSNMNMPLDRHHDLMVQRFAVLVRL